MPDFDRTACERRNRLACLRDGIEAAPMRLYRTATEPTPYDCQLAASYGKLPKGEAEVLAAINRRCLSGEPLTAERVWWRYMEAANDTFITGRYLFLDKSTLRNIAVDAEAGFAFMNSHRTGGMSAPTELPFGWTFAGRYEDGGDQRRTLLGVYMLRGVKPNGDSGPSTDDLAEMIDGGVVPDVSVGLHGGKPFCDICAEELVEADAFTGETACGHYPGTTYNLSPAQQKAQKERGVPDGCASYSLVNARCGEVSSVYNGAVTGAGFRRALQLCRLAGVGSDTQAQIRAAYGPLLRDSDFQLSEKARPPTGQTFADHSESVLTAVEEWLTRVEGYASMRVDQGRPALAQERRADLQRLHDALGRLLAADTPRVSPAQRLRALRLSQFAAAAGITTPAAGR